MTTKNTETPELIIPENVTTPRVELIRESVCLVLTYRGDGYKATAYDPNDPLDYPCMTLYGYIYDAREETWKLADGGARVTLIDASNPREVLEEALNWLMQRLYIAVSLNSAADLFNELSWMDSEWLVDGAYGNDERDMRAMALVAAAATTD